MGGLLGHVGRQRGTVPWVAITVIGQHTSVYEHLEHVTLGDAIAVIERHRCVGHRLDLDRHRRNIERRGAVGELIGERVAAVVVAVGDVDKEAVLLESERSVEWAVDDVALGDHECRDERLLVSIAVVGEHAL